MVRYSLQPADSRWGVFDAELNGLCGSTETEQEARQLVKDLEKENRALPPPHDLVIDPDTTKLEAWKAEQRKRGFTVD
jgi:predicted RNase H-like HicB family nuclease